MTQTCHTTNKQVKINDLDDFQRNKMAAGTQNGCRETNNGHSGDVLASNFGQVSPIWTKHDTNMSHYQYLRYTDDLDDFQRNKMADRIQNGYRLTQNGHSGKVMTS
jgi:hypothetical protein